MYIPRLDIMLGWLRSRLEQLPVSAENIPSNLQPEEIEFLRKYIKGLEKEQSFLQRSEIHCSYSMDDVIRWEKRLVGNMNMPNLMADFQSPGDQRSLLQIPQQKAGTPLQSTNLPSSTLSSCTPLASSDLPASVDGTSSRGTSTDVQTEITNKYNFMKEAYIPLLDEMLARWGCRIQQLPISSENLPSHLQPDEIEYIRKYKTNLEKARYMFQMSQGPRGSMDDVIRWEKKIVGYLNLANVMAAVQLPGDLLSQLQIPQLKQHDSNQNNPEKSVSTLTPIERLVRAVERSSPKALSAAVKDIRSVVSMTDVFAGAHPGEGFFHEKLASTTRGHVEGRNFQVINNVDEKKLKQCYSVERWVLDYNEDYGVTGFESSAATSGIKKSRLEVNHVLVQEVGATNHVLINTKLSISDESITLPSGAGEDVEGMIVNCTFSPISRSSSTEKFPALPMWFLIPANYPLCTPVLLDCLHDSQSHSYEYEYLLTDAKNKLYKSLHWIPDLTLTGMAESWDACANAAFSEHARRMEKYAVVPDSVLRENEHL
ncbi:mediator of RNA polymerase II transcription subunit 15a-like [Papaver somniferum]|nr:mediator of RNA polymerase II transcription subunit 15a-like [Papaver somniferum]